MTSKDYHKILRQTTVTQENISCTFGKKLKQFECMKMQVK